jgi:hypothetical protein
MSDNFAILYNYISANFPKFFPTLSFYSSIIIHLVVAIFGFYYAIFPPYEFLNEFLGFKVPEAIKNNVSLVDVPLNIETKKTNPAAILHYCKLCNCPCACGITHREVKLYK